MFVLSQDKDRIVNMAQVMSLFIASDGRTLKAAFQNGSVSQVGEYEYPLAEDVVQMLAAAIKTGIEVFAMPTAEAVRAQVTDAKAGAHTEHHAANGAVVKRRGGS